MKGGKKLNAGRAKKKPSGAGMATADRAIVSGKTRLLLFFSSSSFSLFLWHFFFRSLSLSLAFRARHGDAAIQSQLGLFIYRSIRSESSMSKGLPRLPLGADEPLFARIGVYAKTFQPQARFTPRIYISCFFRHLIVRGLKCTSFLYLTLSHFFLYLFLCRLSQDSVITRDHEFLIAPGN